MRPVFETEGNVLGFDEFETKRWKKCNATGKRFVSFWDVVGNKDGPPVPSFFTLRALQEEQAKRDAASSNRSVLNTVSNLFLRGLFNRQPEGTSKAKEPKE